MLVDRQYSAFPGLRASYELVELRTRWLRVARFGSHGLTTDFGALNRAIPFLHRLADRFKVSVVLSGEARFESRGSVALLGAGDLVASECSTGTEAHSGELLTIEWHRHPADRQRRSNTEVHHLSPADTDRIRELATLLDGSRSSGALLELLALLRARGFAISPVRAEELTRFDDEAGELQRLQGALSERLTALHEFPTVEEVAGTLGWGSRRVHRRLARLRERYGIVWLHWREFVHQARMLRAMQLLTAPAATTELVARLSGFRSPSALCHAFSRADLPSPRRFATWPDLAA